MCDQSVTREKFLELVSTSSSKKDLFADTKNKLALEVDGKQHKYPNRKISDKKKDDYLNSNGWKVLRIPWRKIDKDFRIELLCKLYTFFS